MTIEELSALILKQTREHLARRGYREQADATQTEIRVGPTYTKINRGSGHSMSGMLMIENVTGRIYGIKGYGKVNKSHDYGKVNKSHDYGTLTGVRDWYWGDYYPLLIDGMTDAMFTAYFPDTAPMQPHEYGRYECVSQCRHDRRIITANGVWVRTPDSQNPGSYVYSSAHRDCYVNKENA